MDEIPDNSELKDIYAERRLKNAKVLASRKLGPEEMPLIFRFRSKDSFAIALRDRFLDTFRDYCLAKKNREPLWQEYCLHRDRYEAFLGTPSGGNDGNSQ